MAATGGAQLFAVDVADFLFLIALRTPDPYGLCPPPPPPLVTVARSSDVVGRVGASVFVGETSPAEAIDEESACGRS